MGGDRQRVPAAARRAARRSRSRSASRRCCATSSRPASASASSRSCATSARPSTRWTPRAKVPSWRRSCGARPGTTRAPSARSRRSAATCSAPSAPSTAWSCGRAPPRTRCCRSWPAIPAGASRSPPAWPRTSAASATSAAASGCPSAPTSQGSSATWPSYGARCFCVDQTDALGLGSLDHLSPIATEAGPLAVPIDWQTIELVWGADGYPSHASYRDYHRRTPHDLQAVEQRRRRLRPRGGAARSRASTPSISCGAWASAWTATRPSAAAPGSSAARSTPS